MCDNVEQQDQTHEILGELLTAEREQEITQTTVLQAQIVSLLLLLQEKGLITKADIDWWESKHVEVNAVLFKMMIGKERAQLAQNDYERMVHMLDNYDGSIEFARMLGNTDEDLKEVIENRDIIAEAIAAIERANDEIEADQGD